jgi:hypothetical protein
MDYYEDDVLLAAADECAAALHMWPVLVGKAKAASGADNPGGVFRTTVSKLAFDARVLVDDVLPALGALADGELLAFTPMGNNRVEIILKQFQKWQTVRGSSADTSDTHRANASREKASIRDNTVTGARHTRDLDIEREGEEKSASALSSSSVRNDDLARRLFDHWLDKTGRSPNRNRLTRSRRSLINGRLRDGYTEEQLFAAIDGIAASDWHRGANPGGKRYDTFEFIFRSGENVEKGMEASIASTNRIAASGDDRAAALLAYYQQGGR